jgi:hypothetical protein
MRFYRVFLPFGVATEVEVSADGVIVSATPMLGASVGLKFRRFERWVKQKGGEVTVISQTEARRRAEA